MLIAALATLIQGDPLYPQVRVQAGQSPVGVLAFDLTGDAVADIVTANNFSSDVTVLVSRGAGAFAPPLSYPVGLNPQGLAAGDLDHDGLPDLAVSCRDSKTLDVLLGAGGDAFGAASSFPLGPSSFPGPLALGDLDADGHRDAVVTRSSGLSSGVEILLGDGLGAFGAPAFHLSGKIATNVALGDANGDGVLDLWVSTTGTFPQPGRVELSLGLGSGAFAAWLSVPLQPEQSDVHVRDLDQDGDLDAALGDWQYQSSVMLLAGDGAGGLGAPQPLAVGLFPRTVESADLDQDGDHDLLVADSAGIGYLHLLENQGAFSFGAPVSVAAGNSCQALAVGDVTGDGELDAAVANYSSTLDYPGAVTIVAGLADLAAAEPELVPGAFDANDLDLADLDGDGAVDLSLVGPDGGLELHAGGAGFFGPAVSFGVGPAPESVLLADLDGDGHPDAATVSHDFDVAAVALGDGSGGLGTAAEFATSDGPRVLAAGDLDGDGDVDLAVSCEEALALDVLRGNGSGGLAAPEPTASVGGPRGLALGDLDGDGALDAAVAGEGTYFDVFPSYFWNWDGAGAIHLGDGAGGFGPLQVLTPPILAMDVALADVDRDGALDVAFQEQFELSPFGMHDGRGSVLLYYGDGAGGFPTSETIAPYGEFGHAVALAAGDLDRDGDVDFAAQDRSQRSLIVHRNDGGGAWQPMEHGGLMGLFFEPTFTSLELHDVDQDGFVDVLASGSVPVMLRHLGLEPAGLVPYGAGTPGCGGVQALGANRPPAVGAADFALTGTNAPAHGAGVAAIGLAPDLGGTLALGVVFHVSLAAPPPVIFGLASDAAGAVFAPLPIPSQPGLAGVTVYAQALWPWPATAACDPSPLLWSTTRGLAIAIP